MPLFDFKSSIFKRKRDPWIKYDRQFDVLRMKKNKWKIRPSWNKQESLKGDDTWLNRGKRSTWV